MVRMEGTPEVIGDRLGPYRLLSEIGSGGMGKVYLADVIDETPPNLSAGQRVAIKVIHPHLMANPDFVKRFLREAEIGQVVRHPNVVRTYHAATLPRDDQEVHLLVMEYVEGQMLRSILEELGRVPEELCRHIGCEVAKGLSAIHAAGVVHRDLKPENVLITRDEVVKVMDLGVARLQDEALRLSQTGVFVGSLHYAAPEQFEAGGKAVDGRTDLYALGIVLYELATGRHPFGDGDFHALVRRMMKEEPRRAGELNPQLSPFFEEVVHTLLEKRQEERFESAVDLVRVFEGGERVTWWKGRMLAIRLITHKPLRRIRIRRETALYGRNAELERLRALYEKAQTGEGQVVLVEGEAGIGKSRLVDEFVGLLQREGEDLNFLFGSYPPGGAATVAGAFTTACREHLGEEGLDETLKEYLTVTPLLIPAFAALLRGDVIPEGVEPLTKDSVQTVFVHLIRGLAAERPTVLLIDDLHFAPEEGRALFASIALAVPGHRVLLVGTMRPGVSADWVASVTRPQHVTKLALARLGSQDLRPLLIEAFRSEQLAGELAADIATKSDGNPFFLFEILNELREDRLIVRQTDGSWSRTQIIRDIPVPSTVMDLIRARIATLEEEDKDLLEVACCWGFEFDPVLVAEAVGMGVVPVLKRFGRIEQRDRLIRAAGRRYLFDHHQVQEALYSGLFPGLREQYHASLAGALETRERAAEKDPKEIDGSVAVSLSEHLIAAGQGARAVRYLVPALDYLEKRYLNEPVVALAGRALAAQGLLNDRERIDVLIRRGERLDFLGRREEGWKAVDEALALADTTGDIHLRLLARRRLGWHLSQLARYVEAQVVLTQAIGMAREVGDLREEGASAVNLGTILRALGRFEEARTQQERNLALAREVGNRRGEAIANGNLGLTLFDLSRYDEARTHFEQHLSISREIGYRQGEAIATGNLGMIFGSMGRYEDARAHFERCLEISREIGYRQGEAIASGNLGRVLFDLGRCEEAGQRQDRFLTLAREIGFRRGEAIAAAELASIRTVLGDIDGARQALATSREVGAEIGGHVQAGIAVHLAGVLEEQEGNLEAAAKLHRQALELRRDLGSRSGVAQSLVHLAGLWARQGQSGEARAALEEALSVAREIRAPNEIALAAAYLALLPDGDSAAAVEAFAANEARMSHREKMEACYLLWKATRDETRLDEAHRLLNELRDHAPSASRQTIIKRVPLHRDIEAAWGTHGGGATRVTSRQS